MLIFLNEEQVHVSVVKCAVMISHVLVTRVHVHPIMPHPSPETITELPPASVSKRGSVQSNLYESDFVFSLK